jgi:hypothetical protein
MMSGEQSVETIYRRINDDLRSQYVRGLTPTGVALDGGFHRLEVRVPRGLKVRARRGYYATFGR